MSAVVTRPVPVRPSQTSPHGHCLPLSYSSVLAGLVVVATVFGLVTRPYRLVPDLLAVTWVAQDAVTLASIPLLLWATRRAATGSLRAHVLWLGLQTWVAYSYGHLAIGAPFNALFLVYVAILMLSAFALLDGLLRIDSRRVAQAFEDVPGRAASWFLIIGGVGVAGLWLSDIVPALLSGGLPKEIHLGQLPNPTWVLDLVWIIPVCLTAAVMLRRRHPAGPIVAGSMLVALFLLSLGMLAIAPFAIAGGLHTDPAIATQLLIFSVIFGVLGVVEGWLLVAGARKTGPVEPGWLRQGWWS